jgi:hypothetical protein
MVRIATRKRRRREKKPGRASERDREHMARVARQMHELDGGVAPTSLSPTEISTPTRATK